MTNAINPSHYKSDTIECIDAMKACSTPEEFRGHLKLTVMKYLWREDKKGEGVQARVENLEKAAWYLDRLVKDLRADDPLWANVTHGDDLTTDLAGDVHKVRGGGVYVRPVTVEVRDVIADEPIPPHTINAADQEWIENMGEQPVEDYVLVDTRWKTGNDVLGTEAGIWCWSDDSLTHWRLSK